MSAKQIIESMPSRYRKGSFDGTRTFYFSIEGTKYTVTIADDACTVTPGKAPGKADVVLKTTEKLFVRMVVGGKMPGAMDIARGRIKTNDPAGLKSITKYFDL